MPKSDDDFDFGFSMIDEHELETVQKAKEGEETWRKTAGVQVESILNAVMPLLLNLKKNPEKDIIKWPGKDREAKIQGLIDKLNHLAN